MEREVLQEFGAVWDKMQSIEKKLSDFTATRTDGVKAIDGRAWKPDTLYEDGDTILYGNTFARCLHTNRGISPTNKVYWERFTVSDMILELIERVSALEQEGE